MIEQHVICGHGVVVQLLEVQPDRYRWVWQIDGRHTSKGPMACADRDTARSDALGDAMRTVERLERH